MPDFASLWNSVQAPASPASTDTFAQMWHATPTPQQGQGSGDEPDLWKNRGRAIEQGLTVGLGSRINAAARSAFSDQTYKDALNDEQAKLGQYRSQHPIESTALEVGGALPLALATGGLGAAGESAELARGVSTGKKLWDAAKVGGAFGAVSGAGESKYGEDKVGAALKGGVIGAGLGAASLPVMGAAGWAGQKLKVPQMSAALADKLGLTSVGDMIGTRGSANERLAQSMAQDQVNGFTPPSAPVNRTAPAYLQQRGLAGAAPGAPDPMALHQLGPSAEGMVEKQIANRAGEGRGILVNALNDQKNAMRPGVTRALEEGTGFPSSTGMPDLKASIDNQRATADRLYAAARRATEGTPVESETLDEILKTPAGQDAWAYARRQKLDRFKQIPTVEQEQGMPEGLAAAGTTPESWQNMQRLAREQGMDMGALGEPEKKELPDPEMLHYMKQRLAGLARIGQPETSGDAQRFLGVWDRIRDELPPEWRAADAATAKMFRLTDMQNRGRNVFNTAISPPGSPKRALANSLGTLENTVATSPADEALAARQGAAGAAFNLMDTMGKNRVQPGLTFNMNPQRARQLGLAMQSPDAASQFQDVIGAWDRAAQQGERLIGNSRSGFRMGANDPDPVASAGKELMTLNPGRAIKSLFTGASKEGDRALDQQTATAIAKIITSSDPGTLDQVMQAALRRRRVGAASRGIAGLAAAFKGSEQ